MRSRTISKRCQKNHDHFSHDQTSSRQGEYDFGDQLPKDFTPLSEREYKSLLKDAVGVTGPKNNYGELPGPPNDGRTSMQGNRLKRTITRKVEVPIVTTKKVPVERDVVRNETIRKVVKATKMVEKTGYKTVTDMKVKVKEEVVHGYRTVWQPVKVPCTHVVKRPVNVPVQREVPYTYYEPQEYEMVMEVPNQSVRKQQGYRKDKVVVSKVLDVERDELYEMRPHHVGYGPPRCRTARASSRSSNQYDREIARTLGDDPFGGEPQDRGYASRCGSSMSARDALRAAAASPAWSERSMSSCGSRGSQGVDQANSALGKWDRDKKRSGSKTSRRSTPRTYGDMPRNY